MPVLQPGELQSIFGGGMGPHLRDDDVPARLGTDSYGLYRYGLNRHGLYSCGLYSYGPYLRDDDGPARLGGTDDADLLHDDGL